MTEMDPGARERWDLAGQTGRAGASLSNGNAPALKRALYWALISGALCMSVAPVPPALAQASDPLELKHFQKVGTLRFDDPDSLLIGTIDHMDVDPAGRMLLVDRRGKQVLLFDSTGVLQALLDPTACHPGFQMFPLTAHFGSDAFIFIQNSIPWGYRFTAEGGCLGSVDEDFVAYRFFDIDPAGALYGSYRGRPDPQTRILRRMSSSGKTLEELPMPPSEYPNATRLVGGGGFIADGEHLFYASAPEMDILKFSLDGVLLDRISRRGSWFRSPRQDLPSDVQGNIREFGNWSKDTTTNTGLFELTDQTLMVQYYNDDRGGGYQVFTKDGELVAEELSTRLVLFLHAANGLAYRVAWPGREGRDDYRNPSLEVYQFVAP